MQFANATPAHAERAEKGLCAEQELCRYEMAVQQSRDIFLFIRHEDGRILEANPAATLAYGYTREEFLGLAIHDLRAPETCELIESQMAEADARGVLFESIHQRKDGSTFPVEVSSGGVSVGGTHVLVSVVRDITERKRAEQALREADRRKDEFLGMLSHELRNPLAPIRNSLYILDHSDPAGEQARRALAVSNRQVDHLARLVDDLLDVTRVAHGKIELRRVELDLVALARRIAEDHRILMQDHGLELVVDAPAHPLVVNGDETRLSQVLGNLLSNAAKFTPAGGRVTLALHPEGGHAVARVRDTGAGIAPEVLPAIFEPFVQGKQTLARSEGGLGLGLALVKGLVTSHGGEVAAASAGTGRGSEFVVRLPLVPARRGQAGATAPAATRSQGSRRVLVVDDNPDAAETLADILRMRGHDVDVAFDGPSAMSRARERPPEAVLCDIGLPGMSGYDFAKAFRASDAKGVLIAVTGYAQPEDVKRALDAGFDGHVAKPCDPEKIERLLAWSLPGSTRSGTAAPQPAGP